MVLLVADVPTHPFTAQLVRRVRQYDHERAGIRIVSKQDLIAMGVAVTQLPFCYDDVTQRRYEDMDAIQEVDRLVGSLQQHRAEAEASSSDVPSWFPRSTAARPRSQSEDRPFPKNKQASTTPPPSFATVASSTVDDDPAPYASSSCGGTTVRRDGNGKRKVMK